MGSSVPANNAKMVKLVLVAIFAVALSLGCVEPFEMGSLYDQTPDLCVDQTAFQNALDECMAEGSECGGVLSYRGTIEGKPVAVNDLSLQIVEADYKLIGPPDGGDTIGPLLTAIKAVGVGDFFSFSLVFRNVGMDVANSSGSQDFKMGGVSGEYESYFDDYAEPSLRVSNGKESLDFQGTKDEGFLHFETVSEDLLAGDLEVMFNTGNDSITGCFAFIPNVADVQFIQF